MMVVLVAMATALPDPSAEAGPGAERGWGGGFGGYRGGWGGGYRGYGGYGGGWGREGGWYGR